MGRRSGWRHWSHEPSSHRRERWSPAALNSIPWAALSDLDLATRQRQRAFETGPGGGAPGMFLGESDEEEEEEEGGDDPLPEAAGEQSVLAADTMEPAYMMKRRREQDSGEEDMHAAKRRDPGTGSSVANASQIMATAVPFWQRTMSERVSGLAKSLASSQCKKRLLTVSLSSLVQETEFKDHLNVDVTTVSPSARDQYVEDLICIAVHAPSDTPAQSQLFQALPDTRFVSRSGSFVSYATTVAEKVRQLTFSDERAVEDDHLVSSLKLVLQFLVAVNLHCRPVFPHVLLPLKEVFLDLTQVAVLGLNVATFLFSLVSQSFPSEEKGQACGVRWRKLDVLPMSCEIAESRVLSEGQRFVRIPGSSLPSYLRVEKTYSSFDSYMDVYIRLFREDCFGKILHDISCVREASRIGSGSQFFRKLTVVGIKLLPHPPGVALAVKLHQGGQPRKLRMINGSLIAISLDTARYRWKFATVLKPAMKDSKYDVLLAFLTQDGKEVFSGRDMMEIVGHQASAVMLKSQTHFLSYAPILRVLRQKHDGSLPFQDIILGSALSTPPPVVALGHATDADNCREAAGFPPEPGWSAARGAEPASTAHVPRASTPSAPDFLTSPQCTVDWSCLLRQRDESSSDVFTVSSPADYSTVLEHPECCLDETQRVAVKMALTQKVALVQGPPGTGKTFIGCRLVELLHSLDPPLPGPILVITYKNHALNEFLASVAKGKRIEQTRIVRVAGMFPDDSPRPGPDEADKGVYSSRRNWLEIQRSDGFIHLKGHGGYTNTNRRAGRDIQERANERAQGCLRRASRGFTLASFKAYATEHQQRVFFRDSSWDMEKDWCVGWAGEALLLMKERVRTSSFNTIASDERRQGHRRRVHINSTPGAGQYGVHHQSAHHHSSAYSSGHSQPGAEESDYDDELMKQFSHGYAGDPHWQRKRGSMEEHLVYIPRQEEAEQEHESYAIISQYCQLLPPGALAGHTTSDDILLSDLNCEERALWICAAMQQEVLQHGQDLDDILREHCQNCEITTLEKTVLLGKMLHHHAKVVGMTVSGAAIYQDLLDEIAPSVVLIEEAAEISEPQVIAALPASAQQLILIGDHKQLKPKIECFAVEKRGLNLSLFERLTLNNHPTAVLHLQNRMRDEFAEMLRVLQIYPRLETNPLTTGNNNPLTCMGSTLHFWSHSYPETEASLSFENRDEACVASSLALWMVSQGVKMQDITILATYKPQVHLIRTLIDEDRTYSQRPHGATGKPTNTPRVQVDSVDNFQGDENQVIILSMVRSNDKGNIGYLKEINRMCVAFSRARCGLYVIGNAATLRSSKSKPWRDLLNHLESRQSIGDMIELRCSRHPGVSQQHTTDQFLRPGNKTCTKSCEEVLPCKHPCPKPCHNHTVAEAHIACLVEVTEEQEECGHIGHRVCSEPLPKCREWCNRLRTDCDHPCTLRCHMKCLLIKCGDCADIRREKQQVQRKREEEFREQEKQKVLAELEQIPKDDCKGEVHALDIHNESKRALREKIQQQLSMDTVFQDKKFQLLRVEEVTPSRKVYRRYLESSSKMLKPCSKELLFVEINPYAAEKPDHDVIRTVRMKVMDLECGDPPYRAGKGLHVVKRGTSFTKHPLHDLVNPDNEQERIAFQFEVATGEVKEFSMTRELPPKKIDNAAQLREEQKADSICLHDIPLKKGVKIDRFICLGAKQAIPKYVIYYALRDHRNSDHLRKLPANELISITRISSGVKETLFRLAESQFHRMVLSLESVGGRKPEVLRVECLYRPELMERFEKKALEMELKGISVQEKLAFHGTKSETYRLIVETGFKIGGEDVDKRVGDVYGKGVYLAETPNTSHGFGEDGKLLMATFLPGRETQDHSKRDGFDSCCTRYDIRDNQIIHVVFTAEQVLPMFVIHYQGLDPVVT